LQACGRDAGRRCLVLVFLLTEKASGAEWLPRRNLAIQVIAIVFVIAVLFLFKQKIQLLCHRNTGFASKLWHLNDVSFP
jgi:hypothetical protein